VGPVEPDVEEAEREPERELTIDEEVDRILARGAARPRQPSNARPRRRDIVHDVRVAPNRRCHARATRAASTSDNSADESNPVKVDRRVEGLHGREAGTAEVAEVERAPNRPRGTSP
jgi:hypothetical protein